MSKSDGIIREAQIKAGDTLWRQPKWTGSPGYSVCVSRAGKKFIYIGQSPAKKIPCELPYDDGPVIYSRSEEHWRQHIRRSAAWKIIRTLVSQRPMPDISVDEMADIAGRLGHGEVWNTLMGTIND